MSVEPLKNDFLNPDIRVGLWFLLGAVGFVLLIACVNVANLLLARGITRQREVAVRASVGASRTRIFLQFIVESLSLASLGGVLGLGLAWFLLKGIMAMIPEGLLLSEADVRLNVSVLLFTFGTTMVSGVLFGCAPAWQATRLNLSDVLKEGGRSLTFGRHLLRRGLVVAEFALALTLLAGGGLALHGLWNLAHEDLGYHTDHLLTFFLPVPQGQLKDADAINTFYRQLLTRIQSVPGVNAVAAATGVPPFGSGYTTPFQIVGKPNIEDPTARPTVTLNAVTADYYRALGIHLIQGRDFDEQDRAGGVHVGVVNEAFAKKYFSGVDPIGQRILLNPLAPGVPKLAPPVEWQIVGVYRNVRNRGQRAEIFPEIDVPFEQNPWPTCMIAVRTGVEPETLTKSMAAAVQSLDPNLPLAHPIAMDSLLAEVRAGERFEATLFAAFAAIALVLAALGIYGVMSFAVAQRTHEIGLRMALGAGQDSVMTLIAREGIVLALAGLALGFGGAVLVGRSMRGMWYQVGTLDPSAFTAVATMLIVSALLACYLPARRATQIDPIEALREE